MRHQKTGKTLGRKSAHRWAMWSNMVASLLTHERIKTTDVKAKELRRFAEPAIAWATSVGDILQKPSEKRSDEDKVRVVHAMRMAARIVKDRTALHRLFDEVGPRFVGRRGGYLRITKIGNRAGDAAPVSIVELVDRAPAAAEG
jgi:large subunit ribosomal protein L17